MSRGFSIYVDRVARFNSVQSNVVALVAHSDFADTSADAGSFTGGIMSSGTLSVGVVNNASAAPFSVVAQLVEESQTLKMDVSMSWDLTWCTEGHEPIAAGATGITSSVRSECIMYFI